MDTKTTNDSFLWSFTDIENDCSLCSRQIGITNGVPGVILLCCQQVVCEGCYKDELLKKNNGSCPFCFFKGENKPQKASISINNIVGANNPSNLASQAIPNGTTTSNTNSLPTMGSGLPLDLSCWLPQNLTAICNPGYQSNSTTTCATSPYFKSNTTSGGDGFNQDSFMYMRGDLIPGVICPVNPVNVGMGGQNMSASSSQPQSFGAIPDGFWSHTTNSASINNNVSNHNATGSSTTGSFISDPWMSSTGGYSPTNGFLHDFGGYDNTNNINSNNLPCKNSENSEDISNVNNIKRSSIYSNNNITLNNRKNTKYINNSGINNLGIIDNSIAGGGTNGGTVVGGDYNKDSIYSSNIDMNSFVQGTQGLSNINNNTVTDIYSTNSIYTWTVQNPITCNSIDSFSQVNEQDDSIPSASVDMDFQRFCLGLGFNIDNSQNTDIAESKNENSLLKYKIKENSNFENNFSKDGDHSIDCNNNFQNFQNLPKTNTSTQGDYCIDSKDKVGATHNSKISEVEEEIESMDLQGNIINENQSIGDDNVDDVNNSDKTNNSESNDNSDNQNNSIDGDNDCKSANMNYSQNNKSVDNSHLFNNSAFPPLTSAIIKQLPSRDVIKVSSAVNSHQGDGFVALVGQNSSGTASGSNQNINNNNPIASSNPKLLTIKGAGTDITKSINSALSGNNGKQNITGSVKVGIINNLGASTGNVSYMDAVLHKSEANGNTATSSTGGRSDNSTSTNISGNIAGSNGEVQENSANTGEDSPVSLGTHGEPYNYKRALCRHWMRGYCWLEADCKFAHGEAELRTRDGKLRHPTLTIGIGSESHSQGQVQTQFQSPVQVPSAGSSIGSTGGSTTTSALTSTGTVVISPSIQQKSTKQLGIKTTGNASYAATAASSLTSSVLSNDSNISYSVMVVSGASNLDSKR